MPSARYELILQNAQRVLASLLEQPAKPWVPFNVPSSARKRWKDISDSATLHLCSQALVDELSGQLSALRQRSAACVVSLGFIHRLQGGTGCYIFPINSIRICIRETRQRAIRHSLARIAQKRAGLTNMSKRAKKRQTEVITL